MILKIDLYVKIVVVNTFRKLQVCRHNVFYYKITALIYFFASNKMRCNLTLKKYVNFSFLDFFELR